MTPSTDIPWTAHTSKVRSADLRRPSADIRPPRNAGADLKVVQRALRHTRHATTADIYLTVLEDVQRAGADRFGALLVELGVGVDAR
jgi:hypothetical protein